MENKMMPVVLLIVATLLQMAAAAAADQVADSTDIANQIVQQLQSLGNHKYPPMTSARSANHAAPSNVHYEASPYYETYGNPHDSPTYIKFHEPEPTMDPNITPSGINVNAALGYISYLVLLVLLQSAVEGVAARSGRRRRSLGAASSEDLLGRGLELMNEVGLLRADALSAFPENILTMLNKQMDQQQKQSKDKFRSKKLHRVLKKKGQNKMKFDKQSE